MAKVWFVHEGPEPTRGGPAYESPAKELIETLDIQSARFLCGHDAPRGPRINEENRLGSFSTARHVILEIEEDEARSCGWRAGYYYVADDVGYAVDRLGPPAPAIPTE